MSEAAVCEPSADTFGEVQLEAASVPFDVPVTPGLIDGAVTDAPVKPDGAPVAPKRPAEPTPEEVAEYDAETARLINAQAAVVAEREAAHEEASAEKTSAKKSLDAARKELLSLIGRRQAERGKPPARDMFTGVKPDVAWRSLPLSTIRMADHVWSHLDGIATLGELADQIQEQFQTAPGVPFGLKLSELADLRTALQEAIDAQAGAAVWSPDARPVDPELWRQVPIQTWTRFGLTDKDVQKLNAGEVKRETGRRPIITVGDLSEFTAPTASGYSRGYADIKGIGTAGADRISEAETKFWEWWRKGGEAEFAAERGVTLDGDATLAGSGGGNTPAATGTTDPDGGDADTDTADDPHAPDLGDPVGKTPEPAEVSQ